MVLVGSGTRDGMTLVSAVLGTDSEAARDANTLALMHFGFSNFRLEHPVVSGSVVARPTVSESPGVRVDVLAAGGVSEMVARTATVTTRVEVPRQLAGPNQHGRPNGGEPTEVKPGGLVGAVLAPHHRVHGQLEVIRYAAKDPFDRSSFFIGQAKLAVQCCLHAIQTRLRGQ